ncbi:tripartite tricarboxylate transporter substrate binding protein [Achromobacter veterisilvae]|uniref:Tripartite tricarboxylate transporter substrate binding protein n=1 Tax=Achromobacter veterisilvae TaxID=2069367 RepID=A0ABZ2RUQ7_9BURK
MSQYFNADMRRLRRACAGILFFAASAAWAGQYPANPVRMIVPYPPGGPTDIAARLAADELGRSLGVSVVVENKSGAGGMVGADMVARARPDGATLLVNASAHVIYPAIFKQVSFDVIDSFTPVTQLVQVPLALLVPVSLPVNNVPELIQYIKDHPGKVAFASAGNGGAPHLAAELFKKEAGVDILHVPYKGSAPALTDLMGGQVQMMFDSMTSSLAYVKAGKLKALAVTTPERSSMLPDVPTMKEAALPSYALTNWYGLWAPKGMPAPLVKQIEQALNAKFHTPEIREKLNAIGAEPVISSPEDFARFVVTEKERWGRIAQDSGATLN